MAEILVTGGTGTLGGALVARLREQGCEPRVLSRHPGPGRAVGDLETGVGIAAAVRGADVVVHAASRPGHDVAQAHTLLDALRDEGGRAGGTPHLVFVSIVGVDRVPLAYYRDKFAVERMIADAGVPWTVQRATQFHDLLATLFGVLGRTPVLPVLPGARFQPASRSATSRSGWPPSRSARPPAGPTTWAARRSARWATWHARGRRRPGGAAWSRRSRCTARWPAPCARAACSPRTTSTAASPSRSSSMRLAPGPGEGPDTTRRRSCTTCAASTSTGRTSTVGGRSAEVSVPRRTVVR
jgi:NAD(P)H-binding